MDFLGCQKIVYNRAVNPPPTDFDWLRWRQIGGEAVISRPVIWDAKVFRPTNPVKPGSDKKPNRDQIRSYDSKLDSDISSSEEDEESKSRLDEKSQEDDLELQSSLDRQALQAGKTKICLVHRSTYIADLVQSGSIYQAALTAYARGHNITEAQVMDQIRQNRRLSTAPETARMQYEASTGLYYDPDTSLYYDSARGYFYDGQDGNYYYWSESEHRYLLANSLIQAELAAAHQAQLVATQAAQARAAAEREAAQKVARQVAAQLAEIRSKKDDYAAYAYATCVIPQQERGTHGSTPGTSAYQTTTAAAYNIESSMQAWNARPLVPYDETDGDYRSGTPPPPGL